MSGLLHVAMAPKPGLSLDQFHEWYNNEHGPTRLRMPHMFQNGLRYRATDGLDPEFLAVYDVTDMSLLETPTYTELRERRSPREAETIGQVDVNRRFLDLVGSQQSESFVPAEQLTDDDAAGRVLIQVEVSLRDNAPDAEAETVRWYAEEHIPMLAKVPGWLRSRIFRTPAKIEGQVSTPVTVITLHEFAQDNALEGPEHRASMNTPWRTKVFASYIAEKHRRAYEILYIFGPGPRELDSLAKLPRSKSFTAMDKKWATTAGECPHISAFVTTADGLTIPYRLEGSTAANAPTVAFSNSLLTSLHMWDPLVEILKAARPDLRILRYDTRGRHAVPEPPVPATLDMLADDIATLIAALRIPKLHALIGVSMGGATTLKFALKYPHLTERFIACDFNVASSDANTQAWKDRIAMAESPEQGISALAKVTVPRWFHEYTMTDRTNIANWMTEMVAENSVQGFRYGCQALWGYNMREEMKGCTVPGLFVVGDQDGKGALVKAMDGFKGSLGKEGAELKIVEKAGHLPMCEDPEGFWKAIEGFL
ncbi:Alpha/Beta hydrolase protein [Cercophora newfieldiana]|uniref:Alpha/Beta hydrolase protein n=1 Tax=Cercophora newfieldiana TaxID=92897 RepID=A0AA39YEB8_9PEZI|nr:Alpha/Beta hydrolase protein [Cercophora newfieldiana]